MRQNAVSNSNASKRCGAFDLVTTMTLIIGTSLYLTSCGTADGVQTGIDAASQTQVEETNGDAFYIATDSDLPACDSSIKNRLVYVKSAATFKTCDGTSWSTVSIVGATGATGAAGAQGPAGANGMGIVKKWKFHVDSFIGEPDVSDEAADMATKLGDVRIYKFSDSSFFVTVSGNWLDLSVTPTEKSDFTHTFFVRSSETTMSEIFKLSTYSTTRIRYTVGTSTSTPIFRAVVDIDGSFADNTDISFVMTEVP